MSIYNIRVYHDKTNRVAKFEGWEFPDKDQARAWGMLMASIIYHTSEEASVYVDWVKEKNVDTTE